MTDAHPWIETCAIILGVGGKRLGIMCAALNFAKLLSAFGVPVALFIAFGNALWQSHLQRRQFKISLFDKRFPVYETLRRFLAFGMKKTEAECVAFLQETKDGKVLFGPAFDDFVNKVRLPVNP